MGLCLYLKLEPPACAGSAHPFVDYLEARVGDGAICMQIIFKPQDCNSDLQGWVLQTWFLPIYFLFSGA